MSKWIYAAILALGVAAGLTAPAQARLDNGPISSLYDADGRSAQRAKKQSASKSYGKKQYGKKQYGKKQARNAGVKTAASGKKHVAGRQARTVTVATGRTLARTVLADALVRLQPVLRQGEVRVQTGALAEIVRMLEHNEVDFSLIFHHAALTFRLDGRQFSHATVASDKLVPVSRTDANGVALHGFDMPGDVPFLSYARTLAMGRMVEDLLVNNAQAPRLKRHIECDSADALYEYVLRGLGVAWLPWSMVQADCKAGRLIAVGGRRLEIRFEVRLYRPKRRLSELAEAVWHAMTPR